MFEHSVISSDSIPQSAIEFKTKKLSFHDFHFANTIHHSPHTTVEEEVRAHCQKVILRVILRVILKVRPSPILVVRVLATSDTYDRLIAVKFTV